VSLARAAKELGALHKASGPIQAVRSTLVSASSAAEMLSVRASRARVMFRSQQTSGSSVCRASFATNEAPESDTSGDIEAELASSGLPHYQAQSVAEQVRDAQTCGQLASTDQFARELVEARSQGTDSLKALLESRKNAIDAALEAFLAVQLELADAQPEQSNARDATARWIKAEEVRSLGTTIATAKAPKKPTQSAALARARALREAYASLNLDRTATSAEIHAALAAKLREADNDEDAAAARHAYSVIAYRRASDVQASQATQSTAATKQAAASEGPGSSHGSSGSHASLPGISKSGLSSGPSRGPLKRWAQPPPKASPPSATTSLELPDMEAPATMREASNSVSPIVHQTPESEEEDLAEVRV